MITTHGQTESQPLDRVNDTGDRRFGLDIAELSRIGTVARIRTLVRKNTVLTALSTQVMAFHD
jgi:hypothetical protein